MNFTRVIGLLQLGGGLWSRRGHPFERFTSSVIPVPRVILPAFDTGVETLALISEATPQRTIEPNAALLAGVFEGRKL